MALPVSCVQQCDGIWIERQGVKVPIVGEQWQQRLDLKVNDHRENLAKFNRDAVIIEMTREAGGETVRSPYETAAQKSLSSSSTRAGSSTSFASAWRIPASTCCPSVCFRKCCK